MSQTNSNKYDSIKALPKFLENVDVASQMPAWDLALLTACSMIGRDIVAGGVRQLGWHQTLAEYRTTHPAIQGPADADGVLPPLAAVHKMAAPDIPNVPGIGASAAQSTYFDRMQQRYQSWQDADTKVLSLIMESLSEDLLRATKDIANGTGHADRSIEYFVTYLRTNYGGATPSGLKLLQDALAEPIRTESEITGGISNMMELFANLARIGQPKSTSDQLEYVTAACVALPNVSKFIRKFKESTDDLDRRTVPALLAYLTSKKEFFTTESAGYVGGAALRPPNPTDAAIAAALFILHSLKFC